MFTDFFQTWPVPANHIVGTYDLRLVVLAYLVAVFASYVALDITGRLRDPGNTNASGLLWLVGGAIAMGAGIWSMHFIGMLSFSVPMITINYDLYWTCISLLVAIIASGFALSMLKNKNITFFQLGVGGIILGLAIASMHYTGMQAMAIIMGVHYLPGLFSLSIVIAIVASEAALWLAIKSNQVVSRLRIRLKAASALIMGLAICGMHYTGMAAAIFGPLCAEPTKITALDPTLLSMTIATVTIIILGIAFFASAYKEALNQQQLEKARQLGMAEVSSSVLHNVGNVLNSVSVSAHVLSEKVTRSKLDELSNLCKLINDNNDHLGTFITEDSRGTKIPDFLNKLAAYWQKEKREITNEVNTLIKNIEHIAAIISMQQGLSKVKNFEQMISIEEVLDESLLISGLESKTNGIHVDKNYAKMPTILIDKVKLMQIILNIFANAKDALKEAQKENKLLKIETVVHNKEKISIRITDNGIGVSPAHLKKLFIYGFTTKKTGHGFGLHTCALSMNEMGGAMRIESEGLEKGATVTLEIPCRKR